MVSVIASTDLSKEPRRQLSVGSVVISGYLGGVMVSVVVSTDISKESHRVGW